LKCMRECCVYQHQWSKSDRAPTPAASAAGPGRVAQVHRGANRIEVGPP
jgi:hypothetical protein